MSHRSVQLCIALILIAAAAVAQLSEENRNWAGSAVQYLMTKPERAAWDTVRTNDDAHDFIEAFWARRDPTPGTPANEFRQAIEQRTREADKRFADRQLIGSLTDRGKVYVLFGEPDHIDLNADISSTNSSSLSGSMRRFDRRPQAELWIYRGANAARLGSRGGDIGLLFSDEITAGEIVLAPGSRRSMEAAAIAVAREAYEKGSAAAARVAEQQETLALGLIVVADQGAAADLVRQLQEGGDFAALARKHSLHGSRDVGGFIGRIPRGELAGDFKTALAGAANGAVVIIKRSPTEFAVVKILTPEETQRAEHGVK